MRLAHRPQGTGRPSARMASMVPLVVVASVVFVILAAAPRVVAATRTWDGGGADDNWSTAANWSADTLPVAGDTVTFNATSTKNAIVDVAATVAIFQMSAGYTGTVSLGAGTLAATTSFTQSAGTFSGGSSTLTVTGGTTVNAGGVFSGATATMNLNGALTVNAGGTFTSTSGTLTVTGAVTLAAGVFTHNGGSVVFSTSNVTLNLGGAATFNNVQFLSGTKTISAANTMTVLGTLSLTAGTVNTGTLAAQADISTASGFTGGTATLLINGAGAQLWTGAAIATSNLPIVSINKPGGTLTMSGAFRTTRNWTWTAGSMAAAGSTVTFAGTQTVTGSHTLGAVEIRGGTITIAAGTILTASGAVNLFSGALSTGTLAAQGSIDAQIGYTGGGTATLLINGSAAQTFTGFHTSVTGSLPHVAIDKPSGTLTVAGTLRTARNWTYIGGGLTAAGSTLVFNGTQTITGSHTLDAVEVRGGALTIAAGTTLTVSGALNLFSGSLSIGTLAAQADIDVQIGYTGGGTAVLRIEGAGAQTLTGFHTAAAGSLPNLVIDKPAGTLTIAGTLRTGRNWTYLSGALSTAGSTVIFNGTLTISGSHSLDAVELHAGGVTVTPGDTVTVMGLLTLTDGNLNGGTIEALGDISLLATFDGETGTLRIAGSADQTLTGSANTSSSDLANVVIDKPSGTLFLVGTIRMTTASWTWLDGAVDPGSSTVYFDTTVTIVGTHSLFNVYLSGGAHAVGSGDTLTALGTLTLDNGTINGGTIAAAGPIGQLATFDGGTGLLEVTGPADQTFNGTATLVAGNLPDLLIDKAGGTLTLTGTIRTTQDWTHAAGAVDPDGSTVVLAGTLAVDAAGMSFNDLRVTAGTATLTSNLVVAGGLTVAAGTLAIGSNTVSVAGDVTINGGLTVTTGMLTLDGLTGQILGGTASIGLYDLTVNDPGGVTQTSGVSVAGTLDLGGPLDFSGESLSIAHAITGVPSDLTADATSTLVINGSGTGIVVPSSLTALLNLGISNANGVLLAGPLTVDGTLSLGGGNLDAGSDVLSIGPAGIVSRISGHVIGALQKWVAVGSGVTSTYEIGDATAYAPLALTFGSVSVSGQLTASTTAGEHPGIATSPIFATQDVNRWWTLANAGVGFTTLDVVFTFAPADVDPGAQTAWFIVGKWDGSWTTPTSGANTPTTITASGITSLSDFVIGEGAADLLVSKAGPAFATAGDPAGFNYILTVHNAGPTDNVDGFSVADLLPAGLTFRVVGSDARCSASGQDVTCVNTAGLPIGADDAFVIHVRLAPTVTDGTILANAATLTAGNDPDASNDTSNVVSTVVTTSADIADLVLDSPDPVAAGGQLQFRITVTNLGPSDAASVTVIDILDAALLGAMYCVDAGSGCGPSSPWTGSVNLGTLSPGASVVIVISATVDPTTPAGTLIVNAASAAAATPDPNSLNNLSSTVTEVNVAAAATPTPLPTPTGSLADTTASALGGEVAPVMLLSVFAAWILLLAALAAESAWRRR